MTGRVRIERLELVGLLPAERDAVIEALGPALAAIADLPAGHLPELVVRLPRGAPAHDLVPHLALALGRRP